MADQDRFARALVALSRGLSRGARDRAREGDITVQQAETLQLIAEHGSISTSRLAEMLGIDPSTASRNLSGLARSGLIARQKGNADGRQTDARLTSKGRRAAQNFGSSASESSSAILEKVPRAERGRVIDALEVLARAMEAESAKA